MRGTRAWVWVCAASALLFATACDDDKGGTKRETDAGMEPGPDGGKPLTGGVQGLVTDTKGAGIANVTVNVGGKMATTDKDGLFDVADVPEGDVQVAVDDKALSAAQTSVTVKGEQKATVALTADQSVVVAIDDVEKGGTIEKDGVTVVLPENSLRKSDGSVATGKGEMRFVTVAEPEKAKAAPGGMKGQAGDQTVQLAPDGMIDIRFYQGATRLVFTGEADVTFPLGPNKKADGDEVTVWSFDENSGKWKEEGKGTVERVDPEQNGSVKTKAKHFTWWASAEVLADGTCLDGTLSSDDTAVSGAVVEATSRDSLFYVQATSGDDGSFCLAAPQDSAVQVSAFGSSGSSLLTWTWHLGSGSEPASCGGACTELPPQEPRPFEPGGGEADASVPDFDAGVRDASIPDASEPRPDASIVDSSVPPQEICTNGVDDDGDDLVDCLDPSCATTDPGCTGLFFHGDGAYVSTSSFADGGYSYVAQTQQDTGTVEFWFRADSLGSESNAVLIDMSMCGQNYIGLLTSGGGADAGPPSTYLTSNMDDCGDAPGQSIATSPVPIEAGTWYHVARTWTATVQQLYVDGVLRSSADASGMLDSGGLNAEFGHQQSGGEDFGYYYRGDLDEVRIWSYARTAQQIETDRRQSIPGQSSGLIGYWPMNEGSGETTADVTGRGHDGQLQSARWFPEPIITQ